MANGIRNESCVKANTRIIVTQVVFDSGSIEWNGQGIMRDDLRNINIVDVTHQHCPMDGYNIECNEKELMRKVRAHTVF